MPRGDDGLLLTPPITRGGSYPHDLLVYIHQPDRLDAPGYARACVVDSGGSPRHGPKCRSLSRGSLSKFAVCRRFRPSTSLKTLTSLLRSATARLSDDTVYGLDSLSSALIDHS